MLSNIKKHLFYPFLLGLGLNTNTYSDIKKEVLAKELNIILKSLF